MKGYALSQAQNNLRLKGWLLVACAFLVIVLGYSIIGLIVITVLGQGSLLESPLVSLIELALLAIGSILGYRGGQLLSKARQERNGVRAEVYPNQRLPYSEALEVTRFSLPSFKYRLIYAFVRAMLIIGVVPVLFLGSQTEGRNPSNDPLFWLFVTIYYGALLVASLLAYYHGKYGTDYRKFQAEIKLWAERAYGLELNPPQAYALSVWAPSNARKLFRIGIANGTVAYIRGEAVPYSQSSGWYLSQSVSIRNTVDLRPTVNGRNSSARRVLLAIDRQGKPLLLDLVSAQPLLKIEGNVA